jgi:hypothetical protein
MWRHLRHGAWQARRCCSFKRCIFELGFWFTRLLYSARLTPPRHVLRRVYVYMYCF